MEGDWGELETFDACILCSAERLAPLRGVPHVSRCHGCGHLMLRPRPTQESIVRSYELEDGVHEGWELEREGRRTMWAKRAERIDSFAPAPGRALDVGAGFGDFLAHLQGRGWHTTGTEVSAAAIEEAKRRGVDVMLEGQLDEIDLGSQEFDLISLWHVFEHLPHPGRSLRDLAGCLRPGGRLVIAVPNDGLFPRLAAAYVRRALRGGQVGHSWHYPSPGEEVHLSFFSLGVLSRAVRSAGLSVLATGLDDHYPMPSPRTDRIHRSLSLLHRLSRVNLGRTIFLVAAKEPD